MSKDKQAMHNRTWATSPPTSPRAATRNACDLPHAMLAKALHSRRHHVRRDRHSMHAVCGENSPSSLVLLGDLIYRPEFPLIFVDCTKKIQILRISPPPRVGNPGKAKISPPPTSMPLARPEKQSQGNASPWWVQTTRTLGCETFVWPKLHEHYTHIT